MFRPNNVDYPANQSRRRCVWPSDYQHRCCCGCGCSCYTGNNLLSLFFKVETKQTKDTKNVYYKVRPLWWRAIYSTIIGKRCAPAVFAVFETIASYQDNLVVYCWLDLISLIIEWGGCLIEVVLLRVCISMYCNRSRWGDGASYYKLLCIVLRIHYHLPHSL